MADPLARRLYVYNVQGGPVATFPIERKTGARGLRSIVEAIMIDIMFELPSIEGEKQVVVNRDVIVNSTKPEIQYKKKSA